MDIRAGVLGTGMALPEKVITNVELEKLVDTSDQWITDRTGIKERRQAGPGIFLPRSSRKDRRRARKSPEAGLSQPGQACRKEQSRNSW